MNRGRAALLRHLSLERKFGLVVRTLRVSCPRRFAEAASLPPRDAADETNKDDMNSKHLSDDIIVDAVPNPSVIEGESAAGVEEEVLKAPEKLEMRPFAAEVSQLLQIVAHSLYTDKEVFLRELVSNACDALEKLRFLEAANETTMESSDRPLQIEIDFDSKNNTISIRDGGIGFTAEQLVNHLGTIARSGSKAFLQQLKEGGKETSTLDSIIGQFGVGFYSVYMVADRVEVFTKSVELDAPPQYWCSSGMGQYEMGQLDADHPSMRRGTRMVIHLKPECSSFASETELRRILHKHSRFVSFPILLNGETIETTGALWMQRKEDVSEDDYTSFYQQQTGQHDDPREIIHFSVDAPLDMSSLLFIPQRSNESFGMGREKPGVHVYSRKVLIGTNMDGVLPSWLRFVKGVVDSADLPLNISRETMQDSSLLKRINGVLTKKIIRHLKALAKRDSKTYLDLYKQFAHFFKEGTVSDTVNSAAIASLLRFDVKSAKSNGTAAAATEEDENLISLDDYISTMRPEQKSIYYIVAPSREIACRSPYIEPFLCAGVDVIIMYRQVDEIVMKHLAKYESRNLVNVESADIDKELSPFPSSSNNESKTGDSNKDENASSSNALMTQQEKDDIIQFFKEQLGEKLSGLSFTNRVMSVPILIVGHESGDLRRLMQMMNEADPMGARMLLQSQSNKIELNSRHEIMRSLPKLIHCDPDAARLVVRQLFDNARISAKIIDDPIDMVPQLNDLIQLIVKQRLEINSIGGNDKNDGGLEAEICRDVLGTQTIDEHSLNLTMSQVDASTKVINEDENAKRFDDNFEDVIDSQSSSNQQQNDDKKQ